MLCGDTMQRSLGQWDYQMYFALDKTSRFREGRIEALFAPPLRPRPSSPPLAATPRWPRVALHRPGSRNGAPPYATIYDRRKWRP